MRIKVEREKLAKFKEDQEMRALQPKPDISSKYFSRRTMSKDDRKKSPMEEGGDSKRIHRSPVVEAPGNNKWDWLYKVGVQKLIEQKKAGRIQEDIILEREPHEYTFHPNKVGGDKGKSPK